MNPSISTHKTVHNDALLRTKQRGPVNETLRKSLLLCGILASLLYVAMMIITAQLYEGYSSASQTVSELSAIGAPTRTLWVTLGVFYGLLSLVFAYGVWKSAGENRQLRIAGILLIAYSFVGFFWPPMHTREILAAGGGTLTDTLHIAFTAITVPLMLLSIGFAASALGRQFRLYSIAALVIMVFFGTLTGIEGPKLSTGEPTPWVGVWERILIGVYLLWVVTMAVMLMRKSHALQWREKKIKSGSAFASVDTEETDSGD